MRLHGMFLKQARRGHPPILPCRPVTHHKVDHDPYCESYEADNDEAISPSNQAAQPGQGDGRCKRAQSGDCDKETAHDREFTGVEPFREQLEVTDKKGRYPETHEDTTENSGPDVGRKAHEDRSGRSNNEEKRDAFARSP